MQTRRCNRIASIAFCALTLSLPVASALAAAGDSTVDTRPARPTLPPQPQLDVPEPGTLALVGLGLAGVVLRRRSPKAKQ